MKNKFLLSIIFNLFFINNLCILKKLIFRLKEIEFLQDQTYLTIAKNAKAIIKKDKIVIEGDKLNILKINLFINKNGTILTTSKEFEIESNLIEYKIDESNINSKMSKKLKDFINDLIMNSDEINYDK